jgi:hypothetical protein
MKHNLLPLIEEMRLPGENALETARRVLVNNALGETRGFQVEAAFLLRVTARGFNYWCADLGLRPIDRIMRIVAEHQEVAS